MPIPERPERPRSRALDHNYDQQRKSRNQEDRVARRIRGRRQPGSGAIQNDAFKGDIKHDRFLIEAKRTNAKSITVKSEWLLKIEDEARILDKLPALSLEIGGVPPTIERDWCMIPMSVFDRLVNRGSE